MPASWKLSKRRSSRPGARSCARRTRSRAGAGSISAIRAGTSSRCGRTGRLTGLRLLARPAVADMFNTSSGASPGRRLAPGDPPGVADLRTALQDALGPIYRVEREVRPVGACRMFVALEPTSGPALLVKVLPGELSLALDTALLERELLLLAERLSAAPLAPPRGSGRAGAFVYHSRAFVEGTTLRAWLARSGELPLRRTVDILRDVLTALTHAHAAHIAHGDLKPENVLLTDGHTLVADTGIVEAVERSLPRGTPGLVTGALCATTYVAPERRAPGGKNGAAAAGPADDMFAVGVLVHEMLTGKPPAPESEALEEVRSVPAWLAELARRCLAADPAGRWADGGAALAAMS